MTAVFITLVAIATIRFLYIIWAALFNICSGQEYPAVVEFAPFQKISKKKLKKKDAKAGSIEEGINIYFKCSVKMSTIPH